MTRTAAAGVCLLLLLAACATQQQPVTPSVEAFESPAGPGSSVPHLAAHRSRLYLSWLQDDGDGGHEFQYAVRQGNSWSDVRTIFRSDQFFANWADRPSIVELSDGTLVAHWLEKSGPDTYAYDVRLSHSADGRNWSQPISPHDDSTQTEHGFVTLLPDDDRGALVIWLDGRDFARKDHENAEMSLRSARFTPQGLVDASVLDPRTCDCCPTAAVRTSRGVVVAYRDRTDDETRDISVVLQTSGSWSQPHTLHDDGWTIAGCPVNGPVLDARAGRVIAAWFTEAQDEPRIHVAVSHNSGDSFSLLGRIDDGEPLGRVDVAWLATDEPAAIAVWIEAPPGADAALRARRIGAGGAHDRSFLVARTSAERASGFPQVACLDDVAYVAWTDVADEPQVRMSRVTRFD